MSEYKTTAFDLKLALIEYFRLRRGCVCVDEFQGADVIADSGKEIIEVEVKVTKYDLINGERKKARKHNGYKEGGRFGQWWRPNKFLFCVPERLVEDALCWANRINELYGVMAFDTEQFEQRVLGGEPAAHFYYLRVAKSARPLGVKYNERIRWAIAKRTSAKIMTLKRRIFQERVARC
jgi:hypothetical protein